MVIPGTYNLKLIYTIVTEILLTVLQKCIVICAPVKLNSSPENTHNWRCTKINPEVSLESKGQHKGQKNTHSLDFS